MFDRPSMIELRAGLAALALRVSSGDATIDPALRDKLRVAVDDLRLLGWPPERVIITVKQMAEDAGLRPSRNVLMAGEPSPNDAAIQQVVRFCIEQYYGNRRAL